MTPEEFRALTARIAQNLDNQALVTELLTQANESFEQTSTHIDTLNLQAQETATQIEQLQRTNMNLFLKVGQPTPPAAEENLVASEQLTYDDLLSEFEGSNI